MKSLVTALLVLMAASSLHAKEYHVAIDGSDNNTGSPSKPFKTISAAAQIARPGDVITVHEGVYRERINPPRGGESDDRRIEYRAAPGEKVVIKGSEIVREWTRLENDTWTVTLPNSFFGDFNPFNDPISGDWFDGKGREYHTAGVFLNGRWLDEAIEIEHVLKPIGAAAEFYSLTAQQALLNIAWLRIGEGAGEKQKIQASAFTAQYGIKTAECSEGGDCIGWIEHGDWIKYERVDFGSGTERIEIRAASPTGDGRIELRLDEPDGELIGTCEITDTGGWQTWSSFPAKIQLVRGVRTLCLQFRNTRLETEILPDKPLWFAKVDKAHTTVWAQFRNVDPNEQEVEVNVRQTVFYPENPGMNYITVRGFIMQHAATNWAPPTAEQIGLIGTHWSKGWIIEDNDVSYSTCSGISLGKHGDEYDNTSENSAEGYVETIKRALKRGWSKENIGHHVVRNNHVSYCRQAGIVGSMGAVFSNVTGNEIHDIHFEQLFTGAEMAGIKFHGAIDTVIRGNHIYRCGGHGGIWLDWMTQGTRVTGNLLHDNSQDLFVEVNHGPFLVDNNLFLSPGGLLESCGGGAYVHNLFACNIRLRAELDRETPYHPPHSTEVLGLSKVVGDDERFHNNIFVGYKGLSVYDAWNTENLHASGNVYMESARPSEDDHDALVMEYCDPGVKLYQNPDGWWLEMSIDFDRILSQKRAFVTTELLGRAMIPNAAYEQADGSPYYMDTDYFGEKTRTDNPAPGPFQFKEENTLRVKVYHK